MPKLGLAVTPSADGPVIAWADAFPWMLDARFRGSLLAGEAWDTEDVQALDSAQRLTRLAAICAFALERMGHWTFGEVFPSLVGMTDLYDLPLSPRSRNVLARQGLRRPRDIVDIELRTMASWTNVGDLTMRNLLTQVGEAVVSGPVDYASRAAAATGRHAISAAAAAPGARQLTADVGILTSWHALLGDPSARLLTDPVPDSAPESVHNARRRLLQATVGQLTADTDPRNGVADALDGLFAAFDPRDLAILQRRSFAATPQTLHALAGKHGLTRERVRQLEVRARRQVQAAFDTSERLGVVAETVRREIGARLPLDSLLSRYPALSRESATIGLPAWNILAKLDGSYVVERNWCVAPSMSEALARTRSELADAADADGRVNLAELPVFNRNLGVEDDARAWFRWLRHCGYLAADEFGDAQGPLRLTSDCA